MQEHLWKNYFHFSRKERAALLILLFTILLLIFLPRCFNPPVPAPQLDLAAMNSLNNKQMPPAATGTINAETYNAPPATAIHLFAFNPNTITEAGLKQLGLPPKTILTLMHYREKGGTFRKPGDLRKIYGLRPEEANRLIPYVSIPAPRQTATTSYPSAALPQQGTTTLQSVAALPRQTTAFQSSPPTSPSRKLSPGKQLIPTNINTATAADWKKFPGIGEVLSKRIVAFRNKLGNFQSVYQVQQTYGLPDSVFSLMLPYLYVDTTTVAPPAVKTTVEYPNAFTATAIPGNRNYKPEFLQTSPDAARFIPAVLQLKSAGPTPLAPGIFRHRLAWYAVLPIDPSPL
ncbi:ComEA family DNA-binding protein [Filimonas effusa]|uniref:Helix-hairpin-helix domain-containing protein n=1 Tax=Filimonas effusa TaxID=2508721 RepID=A0A4Q1D4I0_9BACT|nr:helix-hairpin-helix domain-containing protein [Filimonas effusa]RXK83345.1 hypothetical protein ESB13_14680 [Filimonas effusa]